VAIDFTPYIEVEVLDALASRVNAGDRTFASREEIEDYLHGRYAMMPPEAIRRRAYSAYQEITGGFRPLASPQAMAQTATGLREDLEPAFKAVNRPVLAVRGAVSKFVSAAALEKTRKLRPDLPVLVVEGTDHYVNEEKPEVVSQAILDFVAKAH
jgi:2-(acetamidomethylene)succinate hydrolase